MCGVVQKESRPMLSCQEISHAPPTTLEMTANKQDQTYQGTDSATAVTCTAGRAFSCEATEIESAMAAERESFLHYDVSVPAKVALFCSAPIRARITV